MRKKQTYQDMDIKLRSVSLDTLYQSGTNYNQQIRTPAWFLGSTQRKGLSILVGGGGRGRGGRGRGKERELSMPHHV